MNTDSILNRDRVTTEEQTSDLEAAWLGPAVVGVLVLVMGIVNRLWLQTNVVTFGWDRMDHLIQSLAYNNIFAPVHAGSFFEAFAWSEYYPPLVHMNAVLGYKLFGVSEDVAAMMNLIYLTLFLGAVWYVGQRAGGPVVGVLATLVAATFPMIYAMSRYLYIDFALTGLVAASIAALLATERFDRRPAAMVFGLLLGAGFLVKWTMAAFLAVPLLIVLWRSGVLQELRRDPATLRPDLRRMALALVAGALFALAFVLPARDVAAGEPLGLWLIPLFALFAAGVVYALLSPRRDRIANALSAGSVASLVISLWYLPNIDFLGAFYVNAYGKPSGRHWGYGEYLYYVVTEQLGPLYTIVFVPVALGLVWGWMRRGDLLQRLRTLDDTTLLLLVWFIVPVLIFATRVSTIHSRYLMPFLPPFAIWSALGLWRMRPVPLRATTIGLVLLLAWGQFAIISFDRFDAWRTRFIVGVPALGNVDLLAHGFSIQYPAAGRTDPDFAIADDILALLEEKRQAENRERVHLGLVVNTYQLHEKHFLYEIYVDYPNVMLRELARNWTGRPAYPQLFEMDFVLLDDTHTYRTDEASQEMTERILSQPADLFNRSFREVRRWVLPSDETIILYERRFSETEPGISPDTYRTMLDQFGAEFGAGDALVLTAPDQAYVMGLLMPPETEAQIVPLPAEQQQVSNETTGALADLAETQTRIFLLERNHVSVDPEGQIAAWLRRNTFSGPEHWVNDLRIKAFVPGEPATSPTAAENIEFAETETILRGAAVATEQTSAGGAVPVTLFWDAPATDGLKVFVQLLGPDGALVAQRDTDLVDGRQTLALLVPRNGASGTHRLIAGLYHADTGERLQVPDGRDAAELGVVEVVR